ncbi:MAG: outer membrane beta-barrel protein [Gemmatimonadaceae bacterium]
MKRLSRALALLVISLVPATASAQWISLALRGSGGVPTGAFAEDESSSSALVSGAKNGFGYGLEAGAGIGPIGAYAGFDHIKFDCKLTSCTDEGNYTLQGASIGLKLSSHGFSILRPFIKGGVTFNNLHGSYGSSSSGLSSDRAPGYEIGAGVDLSLAGLIGLAPQVRYVGQNLKVRVPGISSPDPDGQGVNYFTFDVGLAFHTPYTLFGGRRAR